MTIANKRFCGIRIFTFKVWVYCQVIAICLLRGIDVYKYQAFWYFNLHRKLDVAWATLTSDILIMIQCNKSKSIRIVYELYGIVSAFLSKLSGISVQN